MSEGKHEKEVHFMLTIVENKFSVTRDLFYEGMKATSSLSYKKMIRNLILILLALFGALAAWVIHMGGYVLFLVGEAIFLAALLYWLIFLYPENRRKNKYRKLCQDSLSVPERTVLFYEDHLTVRSDSGRTADFNYEDILQIRETEHLYILITGNDTGILLSKNGFRRGSFEQLLELLPEDISRITI